VADLESGRPMDRLIVGDVGFGKTEVAMRAAFVAALAGMQVAVSAPPRCWPASITAASPNASAAFPSASNPCRASSRPKRRRPRAKGWRWHRGYLRGHPRALAKDIRFKSLGLLIIDEEQHFGVAHKERLKEMRSEIHVLTLTATPIPRTLQLSLTGVRDLSIIATPPVDRLAIRTYVSEFDPVTLREALLRERYRGGQSFIVVPRIADLPEIEDFLRPMCPRRPMSSPMASLPRATLMSG
jgi:transcription-repair coupling factor (superfamily II helicase)